MLLQLYSEHIVYRYQWMNKLNQNNNYVLEGVISFVTSDDTTHYLNFVVTTRLSIKYDHLRVKGLNTVQLAWNIDGQTWISIYLQLTTLQSHLGNAIKCLHVIITLFTSHVSYDKTATWCCYYCGGFLSIPRKEKFHLQLLDVSLFVSLITITMGVPPDHLRLHNRINFHIIVHHCVTPRVLSGE